jgi:hypothetical protein
MEQAFRAALDDLAEKQETPKLNHRSFELVVNATTSEQKVLDGISFAKLVYAARKLGRGWCAYVNPWGRTPNRFGRLQNDWTWLSAALIRLPNQQRVTVLRAFVESLDLGHLPSSARKSSYLQSQRVRCPEQFSGLSEIPGVTCTSQTAFIVHAVEELADCPPEERQRLHATLARVAPEQGSGSADWLFAELATWITLRHGGD